jgi:hypothetical protein
VQKFQVFVSSTFEDLRLERDTVVRAVLEMGHIPVGMEMFSAADDEQWKIIARHIDESDYYVVIIAHRYGSAADGESYTRKEYEYAIRQGVPVLGFIIDQSAEWPVDKVDTDPDAVKALTDFKNRVKEKPVDFWRSSDDLHAKCAVALMKAFTANPRVGWVRANEVAGPAVTTELTRLSAENAKLREALAAAEAESRADYEERLARLAKTLAANERDFDFRRRPRDDWEMSRKFTLLEIFESIGPSMIAEDSLDSMCETLAMDAAESDPWDVVPTNQVSSILADLLAMELVEPSIRKHSLKDENEYWSLSNLGRDLLRHLRRLKLEAGSDAAAGKL